MTSKLMPEHEVNAVLLGDLPICHNSCLYSRECGNHDSAGDFRTEDGMTPDLCRVFDHWYCSMEPGDHDGAKLLDGSCYMDKMWEEYEKYH